MKVKIYHRKIPTSHVENTDDKVIEIVSPKFVMGKHLAQYSVVFI